MKNSRFFVCLLMLTGYEAAAQDSLPAGHDFSFSGYAEVYYAFDANRPPSGNRPHLLFNFNRHNEVNLNLAFFKMHYQQQRVRANVALGAGTYMNANYAAEPGTLQHVFEANIGYRLSANDQWWLDVGVLPSHLGFESAVGKNNWTLTRSLVAENSPYFESGARLSYAASNNKLLFAILVLNGWQRIQRLPGNSAVGLGTQATWKPSPKAQVNYSTFFGSDTPDSTRRWRHYHNLFGIFELSERFGFTAGADVGFEQRAPGSRRWNPWYTLVSIVRYQASNRWAMALRGEYYRDRFKVIVPAPLARGVGVTGLSVNVDYQPQPALLLRAECRLLANDAPVFEKMSGGLGKTNAAVTLSAAVGF